MSLRVWTVGLTALTALLPCRAVRQVEQSRGTTCCVNEGTDFKPEELMKMCEFILSDPYESSDAKRLEKAQECLRRTHTDEYILPDFKIEKQPEDSQRMTDAIAAVERFRNSNKTFWTKDYWFSHHDCPSGMVLVTDPILQSWRCDKWDLQSANLILDLPYERYRARKTQARMEEGIAHAKDVLEYTESVNAHYQKTSSEAKAEMARIKEDQARGRERLEEYKEQHPERWKKIEMLRKMYG
mmetsp:Transcript_18219/g.22377  ORF Transcript_18219/g.22377 Transcript_18219/m.22377 type:complete len:241 (+) Transcript_18219:42-764(+)